MSGGRPAALFFTAESPYPLNGGGALRAASLLHYLAGRYEVDVIAFRQPGGRDPAACMPEGLARRVSVLHLPPNSRTPAARAIRTADRLLRRTPPLIDRFGGFGGDVERALDGRRYRVGVIEHFWCAPYFRQVAPHCDRVLLDLHNVESALHAGCAGVEGGVAAAAHRVFARASERLEREWLPRFSGLLAASCADAERLRALSPDSRIIVYPNALPATPRPRPGGDEAVVFSANLEYHPNVSAVRFFREEIWPRLRLEWPRLRWRLVGRNPEAVRRYIAGDDRIEATGPVEDAVRELARARVAVVPLLAGSGTRFKILEAWAAGIPVVSTTVGAEGLPVQPGVHALIADEPDVFAQSVSKLLAEPPFRNIIAEAGRALLEREFTWESAWKRLDL